MDVLPSTFSAEDARQEEAVVTPLSTTTTHNTMNNNNNTTDGGDCCGSPTTAAEVEEDNSTSGGGAGGGGSMTLEERESRWGFSLAELQSATKVVSVLFHNPSLFVGDPYLADSRLYTMITRDRKTKRENKDVYRQVMNEEKSRRERMMRQQDMETIKKTTMKKERDEALNALLLPQLDNEPVYLITEGPVPAAGSEDCSVLSASDAAHWTALLLSESLQQYEACCEKGDHRAAQHYAAVAYRYAPHAFGSQMPPLLQLDLPAGCEREWLSTLVSLRAQALESIVQAGGAADSPQSTPSPFLNEQFPLLPAATARPALDRIRRWAVSADEPGSERLLDGDDAASSSHHAMWTVAELLATADSYLRLGSTPSTITPQQLVVTLDLAIAKKAYPVALELRRREARKPSVGSDAQVVEQLLRACWEANDSLAPTSVEVLPPVADLNVAVVTEVPPRTIFELVARKLQKYCAVKLTDSELVMNRVQKCHTCKAKYQLLHPFYYSLCRPCGEFNYEKRLMTRDLRGKVVLLTGCRIKIGYAMAVSLLRCGATVVGTTRFSHDALARFQTEKDYAAWKDRLFLFSLDLRDMWVVTQFCGFIVKNFPKIFAIINNAAQTIARTPEYTAALREQEVAPPKLLREDFKMQSKNEEWFQFFCHHSSVSVGQPMHIEYHPEEHVQGPFVPPSSGAIPQQQQQQEAEEGPATTTTSAPSATSAASTPTMQMIRPEQRLIYDRYDTQAESSDVRHTNSWTMQMHEVQGSEAAEVMVINALSPFVLNSKLKPCLVNREGDADPKEGRYIINVSAMEGQFYRFKQTTHPHTNMAKAALNMMTRTSAEDYAQAGIYMNSVDTGWITDESPVQKKQRRADEFMLCPLDEVDAAARCLDLIYSDSREYGKFWKDFHTIPW